MAHKFAEIAFTKEVKKVQEEQNSRAGYQAMDDGEDYNHLLSPVEAEFILDRDSFYMASVSETDWPYVQHRGGPKGFMKVLDAKTIGFADYSGNRQYVSTGNLRKNNRVSLFFMDYKNQRRLKVLGRVSVIGDDDFETLAKLESPDFRAPVERGFLIHVDAFDWNCPKYITPRYTELEIANLVEPLKKELEQLRGGNSPIPMLRDNDEVLGNGPLSVKITAVRQEAENIHSYELRSLDGTPLPIIEAGAHIQVPVLDANGETIWRFYSICSDPNQRDYYQIAVLDKIDGRGGSHAIHAQFKVGMRLECYRPENYFSLDIGAHKAGRKAVLIAGGIGITPIRSMVLAVENAGYDFELHYAARSPQSAAFLKELRSLGNVTNSYLGTEDQHLDFEKLFKTSDKGTIHYLCGPPSMLEAARSIIKNLGLKPSSLIFETFEE